MDQQDIMKRTQLFIKKTKLLFAWTIYKRTKLFYTWTIRYTRGQNYTSKNYRNRGNRHFRGQHRSDNNDTSFMAEVMNLRIRNQTNDLADR